MLKSSTIQLLRFHFSFFLMPVFWLSLSQVKDIDSFSAMLVFFILHLLVYPASNGYNSYMDKDTGSIGGIRNPKQPTRQLYLVTVFMDLAALACSMYISIWFFAGVLAFISASRAYSYRGIRLKKYPVTGYLTVIIFQGGLVFFLVMHGCSVSKTLDIPLLGMLTASLLIGGFYPLTQVYQYVQDKQDGIVTLSFKLGYRGTFIFTSLVYTMAMILLAIYLYNNDNLQDFFIIQLFFIPVLVFFTWWFYRVLHDEKEANFTNSMRMNMLASFFTNAAFIYLFLNSNL